MLDCESDDEHDCRHAHNKEVPMPPNTDNTLGPDEENPAVVDSLVGGRPRNSPAGEGQPDAEGDLAAKALADGYRAPENLDVHRTNPYQMIWDRSS